MHDLALLKLEARYSYNELLQSIEGVSEGLAWARIGLQPDEYMHTEGSIFSNVVHVASGKFLFGSVSYREIEIRGSEILDRCEAFWPDWEAAKAYLHEAHAYWLASWESETDLERQVFTHGGDQWPSWRVITTVIQHDSYHAGQIHLLRSTLAPTTEPPPREGEIWKEHSSEFSW